MTEIAAEAPRGPFYPQVGREDKKQKHRADYDARYQAEILVALLDYKRPGGGSGDR